MNKKFKIIYNKINLTLKLDFWVCIELVKIQRKPILW
jgi:hypothetical protein